MLKENQRGFFVLIAFLITFISLFSSDLYAYRAIQLDQPKIRLIIPPGQSATGRIEVRNPSDEPKEIKIYIEDWFYADNTGTKTFMPPGSVSSSCADWIKFVPVEFTVSAFGKQYVNYTVTVPRDASGGHYAVLFFESLMEKPQPQTQAMAVVPVAIRIGSLFYIEVEGKTERTAQLSNLSIERNPEDKSLKISADFKNIGNVDITAGGSFHIMDSQGMVFARGEFNKVYTFPNDTAKLTSQWKESLPEGKFDLIITIDLGKALLELGMGSGPVVVKEAEIQIGPDGEVIRVGELR